MKPENFQKIVFVMLSGGVDSSVAAARLIERGYNVVGVFMKCWSIDQLESLGADKDLYGCFWEDDSRDASLVADKLGIPFFVWDFQEGYKKQVVDYMLSEYKLGLTPNPDVMCNSVVKFGLFYDRAMKLGADFVATGHYIRNKFSDSGFQVLRGKDSNKDQSYFLWRVAAERLEKTLFPVGEFETKSAVREYATQKGLITAGKKDSQGLCFIGQTPVRELLLQVLGEKSGEIINTANGKVLGNHNGSYQYTIGQRHQLGLSGGPWFVSKIDIDSNTVFVSHDSNQNELYREFLVAKNPNWFVDTHEGDEIECESQIRYRQKAEKCIVTIVNGDLKVDFKNPIRAISPGQSIVFYNGYQMLGGAVIS